MILWNPSGHEPDPDLDRAPVGSVLVAAKEKGYAVITQYRSSSGACFLWWEKMKAGNETTVAIFHLFHSLVVRDGIDPQVAHHEFLKIDEYRQAISPDIDGADDGGGLAA